MEAANNTENDIAATQQIQVTPGKPYRLSAWVKTSNVQNGYGANICLFGTWERSASVTGTNDWQKLTLEFLAPTSGVVTIGCRLGYWNGTSLGKAIFDDIQIEEPTKFIAEGNHLRLIIDPEDASGIQATTITNWIANLDKAYNSYAELMGATPYNGQKITIFSVAEYPGGAAVAGNPILWYKPYIKSELLTIESTGSWTFGIMHELGHDFMLDNSNKNWIWNEEMFANLRMYYVADKLNAPIVIGQMYIGSQLKNHYKTFATDNYDNTIAIGIPRGHDGLMYTLIRIKEIIGWQPFINTFSDLNNSAVNLTGDWNKFNLFLDKLTQYSGYNVRATYPAGELDVIRQILGGPTGPVITYFNIIDADTDIPVMTLTDGNSITLTSLPPHVNIEAVSYPPVTGSVKFILDGKTKIENQAPYAYFGDNNGNFNSGIISIGNHSLSGQAYSGLNGTGTSGGPFVINFTITNSNLRVDNTESDISIVTNCYPNPASEYVNISVKAKTEGITKINVYSPTGERKKSLFDGPTAYEEELNLVWDVRNENKGMYLLTIESNGKIYKEKLIIK
ncbi:MAG: T9SS type A sorting domain-containing protein [Sporocytophaga sp.]|nr:T9SS type A sorting domain-containing protein [Sporocytophaga sp.]